MNEEWRGRKEKATRVVQFWVPSSSRLPSKIGQINTSIVCVVFWIQRGAGRDCEESAENKHREATLLFRLFFFSNTGNGKKQSGFIFSLCISLWSLFSLSAGSMHWITFPSHRFTIAYVITERFLLHCAVFKLVHIHDGRVVITLLCIIYEGW